MEERKEETPKCCECGKPGVCHASFTDLATGRKEPWWYCHNCAVKIFGVAHKDWDLYD